MIIVQLQCLADVIVELELETNDFMEAGKAARKIAEDNCDLPWKLKPKQKLFPRVIHTDLKGERPGREESKPLDLRED